MPDSLYAKVVNQKIEISSASVEGYKPLVYAKIPEFNQETQYVVQSKFVDGKDNIFLGVEVKTVEPDINPREKWPGL